MTLERTPFHAHHLAAGARMVDFGGWEMPVQYTRIMEEHRAVRERVGLFDVSHMGEVRVRGPGAVDALQLLTCNDVSRVAAGSSQYSALLNRRGGFVDDIYVYRLDSADFLVCVNAANQHKDLAWMLQHGGAGGASAVEGQSASWAQLAIQGPLARRVVSRLCSLDVEAMPRLGIAPATFAGIDGCLVARTGYTGEDGFEVFIPAKEAPPAWPRVMEAGGPEGILPCGLGARDTLRLEARNVLYGNDIDAETTPLEAGLGWIVKLDKGAFIGREALLRQRREGLSRRLVAMVVEGRIARPHHPIVHEGRVVGEVRSGTRSPTLGTNIALGYVARGLGRPGTRLQVDVRGRMADAVVVKAPFYRSHR